MSHVLVATRHASARPAGRTVRPAAEPVRPGRVVAREPERRGIAAGATVDPLTGLLDRAGLETALARLVESGQAGRGVGAMLCVDLGGPDVMDALALRSGGGAVDDILRAAADVLRRAVRDADAVGRLGGDDFIVVLEGLGELSNAGRIAQAVLEALHRLRVRSDTALAPRIGVTRLPGSARALASMFAARELAQAVP